MHRLLSEPEHPHRLDATSPTETASWGAEVDTPVSVITIGSLQEAS